MSITISNCDEICNSPTNISKAKMLYTFAREQRFPKKFKTLCDTFYNLPQEHPRGASLGFGPKYDFTKDALRSPSPTTYNIASEFTNAKNKGVGFGEGRQQMAVTGPFISSHKNENPGPGNYELRSCLNKTSYSMRKRNPGEDKQRFRTPGPGTYDSGFGISSSGKYFLAKHKSSLVRNFDHFLKRGATIHSMTPGPGKYDLAQQEMSPQGKYFVSTMHNSMSRKFGGALRHSLAPNTVTTPGPGNYKLPSEFGHYLAKKAYFAMKRQQQSADGVHRKENKENRDREK